MASLRAIFINYYDGTLLSDGIRVDVYDLRTNVLIESAVVGQYPANTHAGEADFYSLVNGNTYKVTYTGTNPPAGTLHMVVPLGEALFTVPIYYALAQQPITFTNLASSVILVGPNQLIILPVLDASGFAASEYILVGGETGVFTATITDTTPTTIECVVEELIVGNTGDLILNDSFVTLFIPSKFRGLKGLPGANGSGSTVTTSTLTLGASGQIYSINVFEGHAFPNKTNVLVTDGISTLTGYVSGGGTTQNLAIYATTTSGTVLPIGSTVTFSGLQGVQGIQGIRGIQGIQGPIGLTGIQGHGSTILLSALICPANGNFQSLIVQDNGSFPINSYALVVDNVGNSFSGLITTTVAATGMIISVQQANGTGNQILPGAAVTFSGPASNVSGPQGIQGLTGTQGLIGLPGHGSTQVTEPVIIMPIGTQIQIPVVDAVAFPPLSYVLLTDGVYSMTGQISTSSFATNVVSMVISAILNGNPGLSIVRGGILTFSGPPGPKNIMNIGQYGTVIFKDLIFSNVNFNSQAAITKVTPLGTLTFRLPNNLPVNYRLVVEFSGSVYTNQLLTNTDVLIGIASNVTASAATNTSGTFSSLGAPLAAKSTLAYPNVISDGVSTAATNTTTGRPIHLKFIGTYQSGIQLDFTLLAAAYQPYVSMNVEGFLSVTCYPLYS